MIEKFFLNLILLSMFSLTLSSTNLAADLEKIQKALDFNRANWKTLEAQNYTFKYRRICECLGPDIYQVTVKNGVLEKIVDANNISKDYTSHYWLPGTIEVVFDLIQESIKNNAYSLQVSFDAETGRPHHLYINPKRNIADDEVEYQIFDLILQSTDNQIKK